MNARGSTEVIVATIGLSMGVLSQNLFTMIVDHGDPHHDGDAADAALGAGALPLRKEEKARLEREELGSAGFVANLERLLLAVDDSANGKFASRSPACSPARVACRPPCFTSTKNCSRPTETRHQGQREAQEHESHGRRAKAETKKSAKLAAANPQADELKSAAEEKAKTVKVDDPPPQLW